MSFYYLKRFEEKLTTWFYLVLTLMSSCSKTHSVVIPKLPTLNFQDVSQVRGVADGTMRFYVYADKESANDISFDYSLIDGTAISSKDYVGASGTVVIPAHETQAIVEVQIKGDPANLRQPNLQFTVRLSNPVSCTIGTQTALGTIVTENGTWLPTDNTGYSTPSTYSGYTLVWNDEFSEENLDPIVWNKELGNGSNGWGNNELEFYTGSMKNVFLSNGNLIIEARREQMNGLNYTSGRITTQSKKSFKFGRIDVRAKLPVVKGMWPALWMLGTNIPTAGWPACGEIDIMELVGSAPSRVTGTMHWSSSTGSDVLKNANYNLASGDFSQQFHVFSIVWETDTIKWYVDDQLYLSTSATDVGSDSYPFNAPQFFIFNVAVGGNWPGPPDNTTPFPQRMFVDYVRVFQ